MNAVRLPYTALVLLRAGVLGHLARAAPLPGWLGGFLRGADWLLARRTDRPGLALAEALQRLGPGFIKLGQALSTRADLMGAESAADLARLQDRLPPFSGRRARRMIKAELGQPLEEVFKDFQDEAVAAASIAQVHFATLLDGSEVAVKILRPSIRRRLERDIRFFRFCAWLVERLAPPLRKLKPVHAVDQFARLADIELDLRMEAAAAGKLAENHAGDAGIYVPRVEWHLTTERVLVMERVGGIRIDDRDALLAAGHDIEAITRGAARCFFVQVFRDGYFHADMHPGNIFVRGDGTLVPVDFGIMGTLSMPDRLFLVRLLNAMLDRDFDAVARLHADAGMIDASVPAADFALAVRAVAEPVMDKPMGEVSLGTLLGQVFGLARRFQVEVQPQFTLLQKTMVMAEGVGRQLDPDANMWPLAREFANEWARDQSGLLDQIGDFGDRLLAAGMRLPEFMDKAEAALDGLAAEKAEKTPPGRGLGAWFSGMAALGAVAGAVFAFIVHIL